jgi:osmotically inducible protein OsmC
MRIKRRAKARWEGTVPNGGGTMSGRSGALDVPFSLRSRVEDTPQTNPEELIGAAHAGCFSMSLANLIEEAGHAPGHVETTAEVVLAEQDGGFSITEITLHASGTAEGVDEAEFVRLAEQAKATCPVSRALAGVEIRVEATLAGADGPEL